jgi:hypothetical protein
MALGSKQASLRLITFSQYFRVRGYHGGIGWNADSLKLSGRRVSNSRPTAWEAVALPTELHPHG